MKIVVAQNGVVINVVSATADSSPVYMWTVQDAQTVSVGDAFDPKDKQVDDLDAVALQGLFRHENLIRQLIRSVRTNAGINTAATSNGLPTSANAADLTLAQFKAAVKALI